MKLILIFATAFFILTTPVFSELGVDDLDKIRSIVKESEDRVKEYVDLKIKNVNDKVDEVDKRLNLIVILVVGLIALVIFSVSIPQIIIAFQGRNQKVQTEKIEKLAEQIGIIVGQLNTGQINAESSTVE